MDVISIPCTFLLFGNGTQKSAILSKIGYQLVLLVMLLNLALTSVLSMICLYDFIHFFPFSFLLMLSLQISALANRDQAMHSALAGSMLYHSIFGPTPYLHPEWTSFITGFKLKCRNGFTFSNVSTLHH